MLNDIIVYDVMNLYPLLTISTVIVENTRSSGSSNEAISVALKCALTLERLPQKGL